MKDEEIYNIFNTTDILGRPPIVVVDAHSGAAGIAAMDQHLLHAG